MGLFGSKQIAFDKIKSVVILEETQIFTPTRNWGLSYGAKPGDGRVLMMDGGTTPSGVEMKFSITYFDGKKEIVKAGC